MRFASLLRYGCCWISDLNHSGGVDIMKKQRLAKRLPTAKVFTYEGVKFWVAPWCEPMYFDKTMDAWTQVRCASEQHDILERHGW